MNAAEAMPGWVRGLPRAVAAAAALVSSAFLITWNLGAAGIAGWVPEPSSTRPLSAILFVLLGVAIIASPRCAASRPGDLRRWLARGAAAAVIVLGVLVLVEYALNVDLGIDRLLFLTRSPALPTSEAVRVSLPAAVAAILLGVAIVLLDRPISGRQLTAPSALIVVVLAAVSLSSYEYAGTQPFGPNSLLSMSWVSAILFIGLAAAVLFLRPDRLPVRLLLGDSLGASMVRVVIPAIVIVLLVLGWLSITGQTGGLFGPPFAISSLVVGAAVVLTVVVWSSASRIDRVEANRREAEARYVELFNEVPVGLFCTTPRGQVLDANPTLLSMLGFRDRDSLFRQRVEDLYVTPADRRRLLDPLEYAPAASSLEFQMRRPDGSVFWARSRVRAVRDGSGRILRYEGSVVDITDEREVRRHGLEAERAATVSQLAGFLAHDLNTPLTNISLLSSSITRITPDPAVQAKIEKIHEQRRLASELIHDMMGVAKMREVNAVEVDLRKVIDSAVESVEVYRSAGVEVHAELGKRPVVVRGDPLQIQEAVANLVKNAFQATATGSVTVGLQERGDRAAIVVSDTGPGIPPEVRAHLFEPFFTTKPRGEGTGLGLPLCQDVARAHGGSIEVTSEIGRGSTFTFLLPRSSDAPPAVVAEAPGVRPGKP